MAQQVGTKIFRVWFELSYYESHVTKLGDIINGWYNKSDDDCYIISILEIRFVGDEVYTRSKDISTGKTRYSKFDISTREEITWYFNTKSVMKLFELY